MTLCPDGVALWKCWTELDIDTWRTPWIRAQAQCARVYGRERLCGRRYQSAPLDIGTLPSWRAPWICAQCARIHGRKTLRQALPKAKLSAGNPQDKDFSQSSAYYATQHAFPPDVVKIVFFQEIRFFNRSGFLLGIRNIKSQYGFSNCLFSVAICISSEIRTPDQITDVCSLNCKYIFNKYFSYLLLQICKILFRSF